MTLWVVSWTGNREGELLTLNPKCEEIGKQITLLVAREDFARAHRRHRWVRIRNREWSPIFSTKRAGLAAFRCSGRAPAFRRYPDGSFATFRLLGGFSADVVGPCAYIGHRHVRTCPSQR